MIHKYISIIVHQSLRSNIFLKNYALIINTLFFLPKFKNLNLSGINIGISILKNINMHFFNVNLYCLEVSVF